ncbi:MAG: Mfa1 fimbrilin C-terminal domain-containing protein [Muribaculaceae bacterium]|nr:Mfa1 fimbrilin C-terminal domain-containing protein [Muribaculaceae bacterium]
MGSIIFVIGLLFIASCTDELQKNPELPENPEDYAYVSLLIRMDDSEASSRSPFDSPSDITRSENFLFNDGLEQERAIADDENAHWVIVYNNNQEVLARLPLMSLQELTGQYLSSGGTVYKGICKVPYNQTFFTNFNNVRVILNAGQALQDNLKNGSDITTIGTDKLFYEKDGVKYHTMTTAMAVINNRLAPTCILVPGEDGRLKCYNSITEAWEKPSVSLYVERLQSKFTVLFKNGGDQYYYDQDVVWNYNNGGSPTQSDNKSIIFNASEDNKLTVVTAYDGGATSSDYKWKASIAGWGVNAVEKNEYLFKYLTTANSNWNYSSDGTIIRNLWAVDQNYSKAYKSSYPDQFRKAYDRIFDSSGSFQSFEENEETRTLDYFSFEKLSGRKMREYQGENTYSTTSTFSGIADPLGDLSHLRCGSHLIICAQLIIEGIDNVNLEEIDKNGMIKGVEDKFFTNNQYWTKKAYIDYFRQVMGNNMNATTNCISDLTENESFIPKEKFNPIEGEIPMFYVNKEGVFQSATSEDFDIKKAEIIGGDGWCYPYPNTPLYVKTATSYNMITDDQYKRFVYGYTLYFAKHYNEGRMYYALPVTHNLDRKEESDFGKRTGDHGVVRNNWYHFEIRGVANPGTSVDDPEQPIIPNNDPASKGLGFEVIIIPWHVVQEEVDI